MVIQVDTAEIDSHGFAWNRPQKENNPNYCTELRNLMIQQINNWLEENYKNQLFYAICIEEMESWILTYFETNTENNMNSKHKLQTYLNKKNLTYKNLKINPSTGKFAYFEEITKKFEFHKLKKLKLLAENNQSLKDFVNSLTILLTTNK